MRKDSRKRGSPRVVVIGNHKGGCGKSTVAMHLIVSLLKEGRRVASFDLDLTQQTLTRYIENRQEWGRLHEVKLELPDHYTVAEPSITAPQPEATDAAAFTSASRKGGSSAAAFAWRFDAPACSPVRSATIRTAACLACSACARSALAATQRR